MLGASVPSTWRPVNLPLNLISGRTSIRCLRIDLKLPTNSDVRDTLTIQGDSVYVRLGQPRIRGERNQADSYLAALRFQPTGAEKFQLRWVLPAASGEATGYSIFEGAPIVHDGRLYVAVTRVDGNRAVTAVACYDPSGPTPQLLWQQELFETGPDAADRAQHLLLTVAGDCVVCGPHAGAIAAVRAIDGRCAWAHRYVPRNPVSDSAAINGFGDPARPRELCPCVAADGRIFAAPADFDGIIAPRLRQRTAIVENRIERGNHAARRRRRETHLPNERFRRRLGGARCRDRPLAAALGLSRLRR